MTFDSESVNDTAQELAITPMEVERALKVSWSYDRHHQRNKQRRKAERERFLRERALSEKKLAHPERCFCIEDGIDVERDANNDEVIRTERVRGWHPYDMRLAQEYDSPVYRCSNCGKEWRFEVGYA